MLTIAFAAAYFALGLVDSWFSRRRMLRHGVKVELNGLLRSAVEAFGVTRGLVLAKGLPDAISAVLLVQFDLSHLAAFFVGVRAMWVALQIAAIPLEQQLATLGPSRSVVPPSSRAPGDKPVDGPNPTD